MREFSDRFSQLLRKNKSALRMSDFAALQTTIYDPAAIG
jgi:hypothetical protein